MYRHGAQPPPLPLPSSLDGRDCRCSDIHGISTVASTCPRPNTGSAPRGTTGNWTHATRRPKNTLTSRHLPHTSILLIQRTPSAMPSGKSLHKSSYNVTCPLKSPHTTGYISRWATAYIPPISPCDHQISQRATPYIWATKSTCGMPSLLSRYDSRDIYRWLVKSDLGHRRYPRPKSWTAISTKKSAVRYTAEMLHHIPER